MNEQEIAPSIYTPLTFDDLVRMAGRIELPDEVMRKPEARTGDKRD